MITGKTFVFIGTSGSGKNTQIEKLTEYLRAINSNIKHFDVGLELKKISEEKEGGTSRMLRMIFKNGGPAPNSLIKDIFDAYLLGVNESDVLIIDGLPRTILQAVYVDDVLARMDRIKNTFVIHLNVSEDVALSRLIKRGLENSNMDSFDLELIKKRFGWYKKDSLPCIKFLSMDPTCTILEIDGEGNTDEVFERLITKLEQSLVKK